MGYFKKYINKEGFQTMTKLCFATFDKIANLSFTLLKNIFVYRCVTVLKQTTITKANSDYM